MKSAHVEIIFCDPAPYQRFPFRAEFEVASDEQIGEYMIGLARAEGLKNFQVVIDGKVYAAQAERWSSEPFEVR